MRTAPHRSSAQSSSATLVLRDVSAEEHLSRLKDECLSTVSHEMRTPLGYIKGYATRLLMDAEAESTRSCLQAVIEASNELLELVDHLLDMSVIGAGGLTVAPRPLHLRALAKRAVERLRFSATRHELRLDVPSRMPSVYADPRRIAQVLQNLLDNALKYTPEGGRVTVSAALSGAEVIVTVADDGQGIPANEIGHLFDRFYRGAVARRNHVGGAGLGLAICREIVNAHGGRIWAECPAQVPINGNTPVCGTAFRFTLPLAAEPRRLTLLEARTTPAQSRGNRGAQGLANRKTAIEGLRS